jgi:hypothetical protein
MSAYYKCSASARHTGIPLYILGNKINLSISFTLLEAYFSHSDHIHYIPTYLLGTLLSTENIEM